MVSSKSVTREEMAKALDKISDRTLALEQGLVKLNQTPSPSTLPDVEGSHPPGLCQESSCEACAAQAGQIATTLMAQARDQFIPEGRKAALDDVGTALTWAGGPQLAQRISQLTESWVANGRPAPKAEPALIIVEG